MGEKQTRDYSVHMSEGLYALALAAMKRGGDKSMNALFERLVREDQQSVAPCEECRLAKALVPAVHILEPAVKVLKRIHRQHTKAKPKKSTRKR